MVSSTRFAWQPFGGEKTVVRGGLGIIRDQLWENLYGNARFYQPFYHAIEVIAPNFLTPPASIADLGGIVLTIGSFGVTYNPPQPYYVIYNLNVQRQLTPTTLLEIGLSGNRGLHLVRSGAANPVINVATRECINPNFGSIPLIVTDDISNYNTLQLSLLKRFSSGVIFQLSYTLSKALDDQSGIFPADYVSESGVAQNFFNPNGDYGRSSFDHTHVFVGNFLYELPFGARNRLASTSTGFGGKLVGGWRLGGIVSRMSGPPFTANLGSFNNSENGANFPDLNTGIKPCSLSSGNPAAWFNPTGVFTLPPAREYGNAGRNIMCGPPLKDFDFNISKQCVSRSASPWSFALTCSTSSITPISTCLQTQPPLGPVVEMVIRFPSAVMRAGTPFHLRTQDASSRP